MKATPTLQKMCNKAESFINEVEKSNYDPKYVLEFLERNLGPNNSLEAKDIVGYDSPKEDVLMLVFIIIFASENGYKIEKLSDVIINKKYSMANFRVTKEVF